ncbi:sn-glycerol-3-phosphate ABC transporter ATP-binding protein UgpC [Corynebacterium macginleyi]|uniref:ABC transporter ATP-binding protein n=1 Tax=Corynebacterium macginleyi TaxID=38290 RepID=UPI00190AE082|nr:sn-glycerol-3-phosphate ABC transporter ATP-binding protein UgpC [Corynebacterium macginleyi]MBK4173581.1 sn-glycerol-3-phosphate ABC transporter ATP-binding protein UgpC [Corynebacterium macginleyi]
MATVTFDGASRIYSKDAERPAVDCLNLDISDGEFLVLVGPSGCGKSTSLRMLAGLEPTDRGSIRIGGRDVTGVSPSDRDVAMVFQNYALYPNMSVAQNMSFALENRKVPKDQIKTRVQEAAKILQMEDLLDRKPANLSGGQRQRVAMGRAIVREPAVFCMDEPLSNLDAKLRVSTRVQISNLQRRLGTTTVYVTHDQTEAMTMGDRVAVLNAGVLQQVDTTREIYDHPRNVFVAGFIGSPAMNIYNLVHSSSQISLGSTRINLANYNFDGSQSVTVGVRPEDWVHTEAGAEFTVRHVEELGNQTYLYGDLANSGENLQSTTRMSGQTGVLVRARRDYAIGDTFHISPDPDRVHLFSSTTGERLN